MSFDPSPDSSGDESDGKSDPPNYYKKNQEQTRSLTSYTPIRQALTPQETLLSGYELTSMKCELNPGKYPAEHIFSIGREKYSNSLELRTTTLYVNRDQIVCVPKGYLNKCIPITHRKVKFTVMLTNGRTLKDVVKGEPGKRHHFPDGAGKGKPIDVYFDGRYVYLPIDTVKKLERTQLHI